MSETSSSVTVPGWAQGRTGRGQGGFSSALFEAAIGQQVSIGLRAPIPLETELTVHETDSRWELRHGDVVIMTATPRVGLSDEDTDRSATDPVTIADAARARSRFPVSADTHNAPHCLSCGFGERTMQVWPGLVDDPSGRQRVASDWIPPAWAGSDDGLVRPPFVWMALDCTCGFFVGHHPERRNAVTVQYAVDILVPLRVGRPYAVVGYDGTWPGGWEGRKRGASSCVFDDTGRLVALANSFWVSVPDGQ